MSLRDEALAAIRGVEEKMAAGKKLTMRDKVLWKLRDGEWHEASELAYGVSWRFGGYLHQLKQEGVEWEKERIPNVEAQVYKYRLKPFEGDPQTRLF